MGKKSIGKKSIGKITNKNNKLYYIIIALIILGSITFIIINKHTYTEEFSPLSMEYNQKKTASRTKLQYLINKFEAPNNCGTGYIQPSNVCNYSLNTNF